MTLLRQGAFPLHRIRLQFGAVQDQMSVTCQKGLPHFVPRFSLVVKGILHQTFLGCSGHSSKLISEALSSIQGKLFDLWTGILVGDNGQRWNIWWAQIWVKWWAVPLLLLLSCNGAKSSCWIAYSDVFSVNRGMKPPDSTVIHSVCEGKAPVCHILWV